MALAYSQPTTKLGSSRVRRLPVGWSLLAAAAVSLAGWVLLFRAVEWGLSLI